MNVLDIWSGNDYAYVKDRGRGQGFPMYASRVYCVRTLKRKEYGNERMSAYVVIKFYNEEGQLADGEREVRARDIYDFYSDWKDEHDHRVEQREQLAAQAEERRKLEVEKAMRISTAIAQKLGLSETDITVNDYSVSIRRPIVERMLDLGAS